MSTRIRSSSCGAFFKRYAGGDRRSEASRLLGMEDFSGALREATAARDMSPEIDHNWITLAEVYLRMNNRVEMFRALSKAIELNPANKTQLPLSRTFAALLQDTEFKRIMGM